MKKNGAQILLESLIAEGVVEMFGYPGGVLLPLYDEMPNYPQLKHILTRHEQGAAHAADAYGRVSGKVGVCIATSGPGATNLVTGIANAYMDSVPMVAITGQVNRMFVGKDAFQEIDITGITLPITKHNYLVMDVGSLAKTVKEAFHLARTGRPGPVLIDIPKDVFLDKAEFNYPSETDMPGYKPTVHGNPFQIKKALKLTAEAKKPVIIAGHGVNIANASEELKYFAETAHIPVVTTLLGLGSFPESNRLSFGMLGMHGMAYANKAVTESDLIIAIGMRFDDRVTARLSDFAPNAKVIHIDVDPAEIGKNVKVDVPIVGDIKPILKALNKGLNGSNHEDWVNKMVKWKEAHPLKTDEHGEHILPQYVIDKINEITKSNAIVVTGVGQHQMWAAQHYMYEKPNSLVTSGGLGTMGFELPAALGAKVACPDETVWCIAGDGSIQMTIQELGTIVQENAGVKIAILNNGYLGMVRQWQQLFYEKRYVSTPLPCPDFVKIAEGYCIPGMLVDKKKDVEPALKKAMETEGPFLINFVVEPEENVYPMVPPGKALHETLEEPKGEVKVWQQRNIL